MPKRTPTRRWTTGTDVGTGDVIESGLDDLAQQVIDYAVKIGEPPQKPGALGIAGDVEMKFAMRMRATGKKVGRLVINHDGGPCTGGMGCDDYLERFLPRGSVLTVYWPNGSKVYHGKGEL